MTQKSPPEAMQGNTVHSEADLLAMVLLEDADGPAKLPVVAVLQCLHILIDKGHAPPLPVDWFDRTLPKQWRVVATASKFAGQMGTSD